MNAYISMRVPDDANRKPEDADYTVDVLTRCVVSKDGIGKKTIKIVPFKEPGEPVVVSVPLSQASKVPFFFCFIYFQFPCLFYSLKIALRLLLGFLTLLHLGTLVIKKEYHELNLELISFGCYLTVEMSSFSNLLMC